MKLISISPFISVVLTPLLAVAPLWAQSPAPADIAPPDAAVAQTLQLRLIASDNSQAASSRTPKGFTVQVTDAAGTAVPDAAIAVRLPDSGATGTFADGTHSAVAYTDAAGRARIANIRWAETSGSVALRVTATKGTSHAGMLIEQTLTAGVAAVAAAPKPMVPATIEPVPAIQVLPQPGTPQALAKITAPVPQDSGLAHPVAPQDTAPQPPSVTVGNTPAGEAPHKSHSKWIIVALVVAAGAGAGVAMAGKGKSNTAAAAPSLGIASTGVSVGQPAH